MHTEVRLQQPCLNRHFTTYKYQLNHEFNPQLSQKHCTTKNCYLLKRKFKPWLADTVSYLPTTIMWCHVYVWQTDNHTSTSSLNFLQVGRSSWCWTNIVIALKAASERQWWNKIYKPVWQRRPNLDEVNRPFRLLHDQETFHASKQTSDIARTTSQWHRAREVP